MRTTDSSTCRRRDTSGSVAGAQVLELRIRCVGRVLGPLQIVLHGANGALRWADPHDLTETEESEQAGTAAVQGTHAKEAGPDRDAAAIGDPQGTGDREQQESEDTDEAGPAEQPCANTGPLELAGDLSFRELDLFVHENGEIAGGHCHELAQRLLVATAHRQSPPSASLSVTGKSSPATAWSCRRAYVRTAPLGDAVHWHGHRVTMRRLIIAGRGQAPDSATSAADARVGARSSCAARASKGAMPLALRGPYPLSSATGRPCLDPKMTRLSIGRNLPGARFADVGGGKSPRYPASATLVSLTGPARPPRSRISRRPPLPPRRGSSHVRAPVHSPPGCRAFPHPLFPRTP